ncbi:MAG TPA: RICIN domain-containing protein [Polyangiaceae bacterium]|nr:RICIN domain-containing protein [Polyangiaceae bacterium]
MVSCVAACSAAEEGGSAEDDLGTSKSPIAYVRSIQNGYGRWLDAELSTANRNGTKVHLWDWNGGSNQWWGFTWWGNDLWSIQSTYGPWRCLDAALESIDGNGTKVQLWDCSFDTQQLWRLESGGQIVNARSGRCLDAEFPNINNLGTKVQLWDCSGGRHQSWTIGN